MRMDSPGSVWTVCPDMPFSCRSSRRGAVGLAKGDRLERSGGGKGLGKVQGGGGAGVLNLPRSLSETGREPRTVNTPADRSSVRQRA